jgi:hypothetical protein
VLQRSDITGLGRADADLELSFPYTTPDTSGVIYTDMITMRRGTAESNLQVVSFNSPPQAAVVDPLVHSVAQRLADG